MCRRGDIYYADMGNPPGCCQGGVRPVIVVSNDSANTHAQIVTVVPLTTKIKSMYMPTHVLISKRHASGVHRTSVALAEQVTTLDKGSLLNKVGRIHSPQQMSRITHALQVQIGAAFPGRVEQTWN